MVAAIYERVGWHPTTSEEETMVRRALAEVVSSAHFCNSKRYPAFLEHVVNAVIAGRSDELKERTLGVEVFGRRPDYDTNSDTVVRYTAGEVRKRLSLYYSDAGASAPVRIHLPVGSYVPELVLVRHAGLEGARTHSSLPVPTEHEKPAQHHAAPEPHAADSLPEIPGPSEPLAGPATTTHPLPAASQPALPVRRPLTAYWVTSAATLLILSALLAATYLQHWPTARAGDAVLTQFWTPALKAPGSKLICTGASIFAPNHLSGVATATKDTDYPFLSVQIAESIARLSGFLERHDASYDVQMSANTPLTDLRERPIILLGGYNNNWSLRLLEPLRFHFTPEPSPAAIMDSEQPSRLWARDASKGYGNADDYAIVARFTDSTTHGPVVVLAGLGRNGTEAATQFVTAPEFLLDYTNQHPLPPSANVEFVLHSRVIDGKTGAPSIVAAYSW